jgi:hypothetical protein
MKGTLGFIQNELANANGNIERLRTLFPRYPTKQREIIAFLAPYETLVRQIESIVGPCLLADATSYSDYQHLVLPSQTISEIAGIYGGVPEDLIVGINHLDLSVGEDSFACQVLFIPIPGRFAVYNIGGIYNSHVIVNTDHWYDWASVKAFANSNPKIYGIIDYWPSSDEYILANGERIPRRSLLAESVQAEGDNVDHFFGLHKPGVNEEGKRSVIYETHNACPPGWAIDVETLRQRI